MRAECADHLAGGTTRGKQNEDAKRNDEKTDLAFPTEEPGLLRLMIQALKVAAILVLAVAVIFISQRILFHYLDAASADNSSVPITVTISQDESVDSVAQNLHEDGLIRSSTYFKLKMRLTNKDSKLKAGTFTLRKGMTVNEIIDALTSTDEDVKVVTVRFQEGWRADEYADKLAEVGLISTPDQFLDAIKKDDYNYDFLQSRPGNASLEGFLFPDTYQFRADATPEDMINTMLENFNTKIPKDLRDRAQQLNLNFFQVLTIASIVEREAVVPSERPTIASVYYNRIKQDMPLEADPTVQYAIGQPGGWWPAVTDPHQQGADSPYNTYTHPGLPAGPICNPSQASIEAALNPDKTDYLFFVAKDDGSGGHYFAKTLEEHNANIEKAKQNNP